MIHRIGLSGTCRTLVAAAAIGSSPALADPITYFTPGDLVISTVSNSDSGPNQPPNSLDTASAITLTEFALGAGATTASVAGTLVLPSAVSGEYGSASEGVLQRSVTGQYLTIMGYGVNATDFNNAANAQNAGGPASPYGAIALGQTPSATVPRVVALINATGTVDTSTALTNVFNTNNPRSAATVDGSSFYVSGQGVTGDGTGGLFYATRGSTTATPINANTTSPSGSNNGTSDPALATETRTVEIFNNGSGNTLYVSRDAKASGTPNDTADIRSLTGPGGTLPTSSSGLTVTRVIPTNPSVNGGNTGSIDLTAPLDNGVNNSRNGKFVYLSPEQYYFASPTVLYIADSGSPKNGSANAAALGEGGLQKWVLQNGVWTLQYDLYQGLNLQNNAAASSSNPTLPGVTGLFGLAGQVVNVNGTQQVELFASTYGLNELSSSYLYEVTDPLANLTPPGTSESFTQLYAAPAGTLIRGVSFAPVPEAPSMSLVAMGLAGLAALQLRKAKRGALGGGHERVSPTAALLVASHAIAFRAAADCVDPLPSAT